MQVILCALVFTFFVYFWLYLINMRAIQRVTLAISVSLNHVLPCRFVAFSLIKCRTRIVILSNPRSL